MSKLFLKALTNPSYNTEEGGEKSETTIDVEIQVTDAVTDSEAADEAVAEVEDMVDEAEQGAEVAEVVEEVKETVGEEGYNKAVARIIAKLGILDGAQRYGMTVAGHESLNATGRNEEMAKQLIAGCEAMLQDWWKTIEKFFKTLWEKVAKMIEFVKNKLKLGQKMANSAFERVKTIKPADLNAEKLKEGLEKVATITDVNNACVVVGAKLDYAKALLDAAKAGKDVVEYKEATTQSGSKTWALNDLTATHGQLEKAFAAVYAAQGIDKDFKVIMTEGVNAAKKAGSGDEAAKDKVNTLRKLSSDATRAVSEALTACNQAAKGFVQVCRVFEKAAQATKTEKA